MAGKWKHLAQEGKYEKIVKGEEKYLDKVNIHKKLLAGKNVEELMEIMFTMEAELDHIASRQAILNPQVQAISELIIDYLQAKNLEKITHEKYGSFSERVEPFASYQDKEKLVEWLYEHDMKEIVENPSWQTVNALVKQALENGEEPPAGVKIYLKSSLNRRGKGKANHGEEN